ncbi:AraC family transcriptional regulator [Colwellia sp. 4_MG-2023]|uniref:AraC family transcriptional regulator n=1 Tax=unclassified Colwellia TaxID=196834 RepID=UPI001C0A37D6|nr:MULTISPECIES: AraC family transcriptional regulator [unclassified Colwellia]MBU2925188.1 AraC family transcriptional regulator [Colwellia sp. C2M11]MDO6506756.1 AraC family transcriptional regulator [Colwellia sp. 5_MG-2023]MDO6555582.1 AraC family transcriptional regulator [Colwellia sp. 4_MG-2023]MDO6651287.1 AraC family transcriptional regulator [Colwellia sp. 3_MG-2023]MDO6664290.1 AraC family transcriptional regulator [Colwellia sp. 2_MG-2023]
MDQLSVILQRFSMNTSVFFTGNLCGISSFNKSPNQGHLHLLRGGALTLIDEHGKSLFINEPSVLYIPTPHAHRIIASEENPPELVCANIIYNENTSNPIADALPSLLIFKLNDGEKLNQTAQWLFEEAFQERCGRLPMIESLTNIFLIHILRHVLDNNIIQHGLLAGLAHPHISTALLAIHATPEKQWGLEELADLALMSRSKFADIFKRTVGQSPGNYLIDWRINVAKVLLKQNKPVAIVANAVGYENGSALARVFRKKLGISPKQWLEKNN